MDDTVSLLRSTAEASTHFVLLTPLDLRQYAPLTDPRHPLGRLIGGRLYVQHGDVASSTAAIASSTENSLCQPSPTWRVAADTSWGSAVLSTWSAVLSGTNSEIARRASDLSLMVCDAAARVGSRPHLGDLSATCLGEIT